MIIRINNSSPLSGPIFGSVLSFAPIFDGGLIFDTIIVSALCVIADCIASMIINLYTTIYYRKAVKTKDLISLKLYIQGIILKKDSLYHNLVTCYSRDIQLEWMKLNLKIM